MDFVASAINVTFMVGTAVGGAITLILAGYIAFDIKDLATSMEDEAAQHPEYVPSQHDLAKMEGLKSWFRIFAFIGFILLVLFGVGVLLAAS